MKVFCDTNVIISGLYRQDGPPGKILQMHTQGQITIIVSALVIQELAIVLQRKFPQLLAYFLTFLEEFPFEIVKNPIPKNLENFSAELPFNDAVIFTAACNSEATIFITGNSKDFDVIKGEGLMPILPPKLALEIIQKGQTK